MTRPALGQSTPPAPAPQQSAPQSSSPQPAVRPAAQPAAQLASQPAPTPPAASSPAGSPAAASTICDATCVRQNMERAAQICAPRIEAQAPTDFEWLTRPFGGIFQQAEPPDAGKTVVLYRGDSVRFLSPQKEWVRVTYECGFDVALQRLTQTNVRLGRLNQPAQVAVAAPAQAAPPEAPMQAAQSGNPAGGRPVAQGPALPQGPAQAPPRKLTPNEPNEIEVRQVDPRAVPRR